MWEHKPCTFEGCEKPNAAHGLCASHAAQKRRGMELRPIQPPRPTAEPGYHYCSTCKQFRPEEDFGWDAVRNQPKRLCRPCQADRQRAYTQRHRTKVNRAVQLRRRGITEEQWTALYEAQGGKCAICNGERRAYRELSVDHDHATGKVRALLCQDCNMGIGQLKDDPELLRKAAAYIEGHRAKL